MTHSDPPAPVRALQDAGVSLWLDGLSRERLTSGSLADLVSRRGIVGVSTSPAALASAIAGTWAYDGQLAELAARGVGAEQATFEIASADARGAADALRTTFVETEGIDGYVSVGLDPRLAHDCEAGVAMARQLSRSVARPNLLVKVPATVEGLATITRLLAEGIGVDATSVYSLDRYRAVMEAFRAGLDLARRAGLDLRRIASVASFPIARLDAAVDAALGASPHPAAAHLRGQAAIAQARLAFDHHEDFFDSYAWTSLTTAGARPQRPLWSSTDVGDPIHSDTLYVDGLVTRGVVAVVSAATLDAVADHGGHGYDTVRGTAGASQRVLAEIATAGVRWEEITTRLPAEDLGDLTASWNDLLATVTDGLTRARERL